MPGLVKSREDAIPLSLLHECFDLSTDSKLIWRSRPRSHFLSGRGAANFNKQFAGKPAGTARSDGYISVILFGKPFLAHRIIFALVNGRWPDTEIDHKNRLRKDNGRANLREAGPQKNSWNCGVSKANTSGFTGVGWADHAKAWRAKIVVAGSHIHIGYFPTREAANEAYKAAALLYRGAFAREEFQC